MEPRDGSGGGEEKKQPAKKSTRKRAASSGNDAPTVPKRAPKAVRAEQNGVATVDREVQWQTAYDVKEIHRALRDFADDDLKQIPIVPEGQHLEQGSTYIDLSEEQPTEVKVNAGVVAYAGHYWIPKHRVPYTIWNRLIGEAKPGQEVSGVSDRTVAEVRASTQAVMGDQPAADGDIGGDAGYGDYDAERAASLAADLKSWLDTRREDRDEPREVL